MRSLRISLLLLIGGLVSGCGYVHFGRWPAGPRGDSQLLNEVTDLSIERKILKQELLLVRKEKDALRDALDRAGAAEGRAPAATVLQLEQAANDLATLRVNYSKLEIERNALAATAPTAEALRVENDQLRQELVAARTENAALATQLKTSLAAREEAEKHAVQLDSDLAAQTDARAKAEAMAFELRKRLDEVVARSERAEAAAPVPAVTVEGKPDANTGLASLRLAKAPPSELAATAELRTSLARTQANAANSGNQIQQESAVNAPTIDTAKAEPVKSYTVKAGDTLESLAARFYGSPDQWGKIYAANPTALAEGLKPGLVLVLPGVRSGL